MLRNRFSSLALLLSIGFALALAQQPAVPAEHFALKDGETVVFYGDSITEQKLYTTDIELYTLTRFPARNVHFINSGVGGDKVSGGWAGPIDLRLRRDVYELHPNVVTIMLGMNDGYYRPFDDGVLSTYSDEYRHMVDQIQSKLPGVRLTLIKPSPFDDVTRKPQWEPGYNTIMMKMGDFVAQLAQEKHAQVADMNTPVVDALTKAKALDPVMATTLVNDRVHPGAGVHWLMAEAVLKGWDAPAIVTAVTIDAAKVSATESVNTDVTLLRKSKAGVITWTQNDRALPLPFPAAEVDPFLAMSRKVSDLDQALNQQPLRVTGLTGSGYQLLIDDRVIGKFSAGQLAEGVNLALLETPMLAQSRLVAFDADKKNGIEWMHFTAQNEVRDEEAQATVKKLADALAQAFGRMRVDAQPVPHRFAIQPELPVPAAK